MDNAAETDKPAVSIQDKNGQKNADGDPPQNKSQDTAAQNNKAESAAVVQQTPAVTSSPQSAATENIPQTTAESLEQPSPESPTSVASEASSGQSSTYGPDESPNTAIAEPSTNATAESSNTTAAETTHDETSGSDEAVIKGALNKGDTVAKLLGDWANRAEIQKYISATQEVFPLRAFRAGQPYVLVCDVASGKVKRFEYEIDNRRRLVVEDSGDAKPIARVEKINYDIVLSFIEGRIEDNLFQSVADLGESPQLALQLAQLFGWEINFIRDLQSGDKFSILVEKLYREGEYRGYGKTYGATFTNNGKTYEAFLFNDSAGRDNYYNAKGENLKKTLLQAPLSFTRVTSGYTKNRRHPIFGNNRPHLGVDYGAPTGTPVKAVGDGIVTLRGWVGGYGNQVVVKHIGGLESMYSHLSGFGRGIKKGTRVRQGQVIAFVGSTGYSTGPHLDFRLKQNGNFVNPTKAINPRSLPVSKNMTAAFNKRKELVRSFMTGTKELSQYSPTLFAPVAVVAAEPSRNKVEKTPVRKKRSKKKKTSKK